MNSQGSLLHSWVIVMATKTWSMQSPPRGLLLSALDIALDRSLLLTQGSRPYTPRSHPMCLSHLPLLGLDSAQSWAMCFAYSFLHCFSNNALRQGLLLVEETEDQRVNHLPQSHTACCPGARAQTQTCVPPSVKWEQYTLHL